MIANLLMLLTSNTATTEYQTFGMTKLGVFNRHFYTIL